MFKIKNLIMHLIISPILFFVGLIVCAVYAIVLTGELSDIDGLSVVAVIIMFVIAFGLCKLALRFKGKQVEYTYWESNFEYEIRHDYGDNYTATRTKGGWTKGTSLNVFAYFLISPIFIITQPIAVIFAIISFGKNKIFSYYGDLDFEQLDLRLMPLQKVLHFLFNFIILLTNDYEEE